MMYQWFVMAKVMLWDKDREHSSLGDSTLVSYNKLCLYSFCSINNLHSVRGKG